ncbi:hypothetical protein, partial [Candidatus Methanarcanum hacksteinii]|uniref:hypothetical protein n=1 Tax=Candidatus Methanarcanum hacksteinii TaxID=2911857 RepID=UPI0037DD621E
ITSNPGASQYIDMITATTFGGLVIEKGGIVVIDGNVVVDKDGVIYNSAEYVTPTTSNKVMGSGPGLFVNGIVTVEKGGEISSASTISSSAAINSKASDTTYTNQMIISSTGSVLFKSTSATSSKVNNQTFSIMDGGILTIDALVNGNVIIGSFSTSSYAITSKIAIGTEKSVNDITTYSWVTGSGTTNQGKVNLSFSVSTEKAEKMYVSSSVSSKYSYAILDVSGSVDDNAALVTLDNCFRTIEVAKSTGTTSTGIKAYGITEVSKDLEINKGA